MGERAGSSGPVAAISPVQQMLASGTGALLTSVFGENELFCLLQLFIPVMRPTEPTLNIEL